MSDESSRPTFDASNGLAEPIEIEVAVADCDPEPQFTAAMAARTPKGEEVLKPMGLGASGCVFEGGPALQATFELREMARFTVLHEVLASCITAGPSN